MEIYTMTERPSALPAVCAQLSTVRAAPLAWPPSTGPVVAGVPTRGRSFRRCTRSGLRPSWP